MPDTTHFQWLPGFLSELSAAGTRVLNDDRQALAPACLLEVPSAEWGRVAQIAARAGLRWAGVWASERNGQQRITVCLSRDGDYLIVRATLPAANLASHAPY